MAATVSVYFKLVDQASDRLNAIADGGRRVAERLDSVRDRANGAFENIQKGSQKAEEALGGAGKAAEDYARAAEGAGAASGDAANALGGFADGTTGAAGAVSDFAESGREAGDALGETARAADEAEHEVEEYGEEARKAGGESEQFGEKGRNAVESLSNALVATGIVALMREIGTAFYEAAQAAAGFETSMAKLGTIADPAAESMEEMEGEIRALSMSSGKSASDLAEAAYQAISASVDTADAVQFVAQANRLAAGGFTDSTTAVDVLTTAINAYGMEAEDAAMISDRLIQTQNLGKTTVNELASSMGTVIPTAAAFSVSLDNLAGGYVTLTRNGINTANATTMLSGMFSELADTGSDVAAILMEKTGRSFTELMESGASLGDVIQVLGDSVNGDSTAFANLWSNIRAGRGALSIFNAGASEFNDVLFSMGESAGAADGAFEKMGDTSEVIDRKFRNAADNLQMAVGKVFLPMFNEMKSAGTDAMNALTEFVEKNPAAVAAIGGLATAVGLFVAALAAYTAAAALAAPATMALSAALGFLEAHPLVMVFTALAAVTAGIATFIESTRETIDPMEKLTHASQELSDKVDAQRDKVRELEEQYGAMDRRVIEAKADLRELEEEFQSSGKTIGDLTTQVDGHLEKFKALQDAYAETQITIAGNEKSALALAEILSRMDGIAEKSAAQKKTEAALVMELNQAYPELGASYDTVTGKLNMSAEAIRKYAKAQAEAAREQAKLDKYIDNLTQEEQIKSDIAEVEREIAFLAQEVADKSYLAFDGGYQQVTRYRDGGREAAEALEEQRQRLEELVGAHETLKGEIRDYESALNDAKDAADRLGDAVQDAEEKIAGMDAGDFEASMISAFVSVEQEAENLAQAYDAARDAAQQAVDSSVGLFEQVATHTGNATAKANEYLTALQSQIKYFNEYSENLIKAKEMGLDASLVEHLADGSQESADALANILQHVSDLGDGTDEANAYIEEMNEAWNGVKDSKTTLEETLIEMNTTLQEQTQAMQEKMDAAVEGLDLGAEAGAAGKKTMEAYLRSITTYGEQAVAKAQSVAERVRAAMNAANIGSVSGGVEKHALGTTYGENVYIAGEQGPELIVGRQGSEVFPASETAKILRAVMTESSSAQYPAPTKAVREQSVKNIQTSSKKKLDITINGQGGFSVGSLDGLRENLLGSLEDVIIGLLKEEIHQEGEVARDW